MTDYRVDQMAREAEQVAVLVRGVLALDELVSLSPGWEAGHDARDALERLLAVLAPNWEEAAAEEIEASNIRIDKQAEKLRAESLRQLSGILVKRPRP